MKKISNEKEIIKSLVRYAEVILALFVFIGAIMYLAYTIGFFVRADWSNSAVFYELIYEALLITIGLEFARMLVTHNYESVLELLAFVIARKMLKPEITSIDVTLGVLSFIAILIAKRYLFPKKLNNNISEKKED